MGLMGQRGRSYLSLRSAGRRDPRAVPVPRRYWSRTRAIRSRIPPTEGKSHIKDDLRFLVGQKLPVVPMRQNESGVLLHIARFT